MGAHPPVNKRGFVWWKAGTVGCFAFFGGILMANRDWLMRTSALIGEDNVDKLAGKRAIVLGLGGVGSAVAEALARSGVGHLLLVDADDINDSNRNRQLIATVSSVGQKKAEATKKRLLDINPDGDFQIHCDFLLTDNLQPLWNFAPDIIIDAIDTVTAKMAIAKHCNEHQIPLIMSMGTGGRLDPTQLRSGTLADTAGCGCALARVLRRELKKVGITDLDVVYSLEQPSKVVVDQSNGRNSPASSAFVPPCAGFALASMAVRKLLAQ